MANVQKYCPKGHAYDSSLPSCPFCTPAQGVGATAPANNPYGGYQGGGVGPTNPVNNPYGGYQGGGVGSTNPVNNPYGGYQGGGVGPTAPVQQLTQIATQVIGQAHVRPVVGWLVCVEGNDIGQDFRLHSDFNHVGRNGDQDVCLNDMQVSGEHFTVSHDRFNNHYFAEMGRGKTMVYINGHALGPRTVLKKGDRIKVGATLLVFIPLEQQDVKWNWKV